MNIIARLFRFILDKLAPAEEDAARVQHEGVGRPGGQHGQNKQ